MGGQMWVLPKPNLNDALDDVDEFEHLNIIPKTEIDPLKELTTLYDTSSAQVTLSQVDAITPGVAQQIHDAYDETYETKSLYYIRDDLNKFVSKCPYCGISECESLDHYFPKSKYKALALCRLNLVPMCTKCNEHKSTKNASGFIHPYYPGVLNCKVFFKCVVKIHSFGLSCVFFIAPRVLPKDIENAVNNQINTVDLKTRLNKAIIPFLKTCFIAIFSARALIQELPRLIAEFQSQPGFYNHWQTAILRGLDKKINGDVAVAQQIIDAVKGKICY